MHTKTAIDQRIISSIDYIDREHDTRLGNKERMFAIHEILAKKPKQKKANKQSESTHQEVAQVTNKKMVVLFTDNTFMWEDVENIDHIIDTKTKIITPELLLYVTKIKEQLHEMLINNPRHPHYQSLYNFVKSYPALKDVLEDYRIQDWENFDETIYTDPVDGLAGVLDAYTKAIKDNEQFWETAYAIYSSFLSQENIARLHINTTKRLLEDNQLLVHDTAIQQRQELHKTYQSTLVDIESLIKNMQAYTDRLKDLELTAHILQQKLDAYLNSTQQENITRKSKKIQAEVAKRLPGGATQGVMILGRITQQCIAIENTLWDIDERIVEKQKTLPEMEEELINIFPPAHDMFALVELEKEKLTYDTIRKDEQAQHTLRLQQEYEKRKNIKDTFTFLYEEAEILTALCNGHVNVSIDAFHKKILLSTYVSEQEEILYNAIKKGLGIYNQNKSQYLRDTASIDTILSNHGHMRKKPIFIHNKRLSLYQSSYPDLGDDLTMIQSQTQQIHQYQESIRQERIAQNLNHNQSNDTIKEYYKQIRELLQTIKQSIQQVHAYILKESKETIKHTAEEIFTTHSQRFALHKQENPSVYADLEAIRLYTKQIQNLQILIAQERKTNHIPKNKDNANTQGYKNIIFQHKKSSKEHTDAINTYIHTSADAMVESRQEEKIIDQTIARRTTTIASTQAGITNLLTNPNNLIVIQDISILEEKLQEQESLLDRILENVSNQYSIVSQSTDNRYQSLLPLDIVIDKLIQHHAEIDTMENLLQNYLPRPGYKMTDVDRSIRIKRDTLRSYKNTIIELSGTIIKKLEYAMKNKELSKNKPIQHMHQKAFTFVINNEISQ